MMSLWKAATCMSIIIIRGIIILWLNNIMTLAKCVNFHIVLVNAVAIVIRTEV